MSASSTPPTCVDLQSLPELTELLSAYDRTPLTVRAEDSHFFNKERPTQNQSFANGCVKFTPKPGSIATMYDLRTEVPSTLIKGNGCALAFRSSADFVQTAKKTYSYDDGTGGNVTVLVVPGGCYASRHSQLSKLDTTLTNLCEQEAKHLLGCSVAESFDGIFANCHFYKIKFEAGVESGIEADTMGGSVGYEGEDPDEEGGVKLEQEDGETVGS